MATPYNVFELNDNEVFRYSDTLSFEIPDGQRHLKAGDPVVINKDTGLAGILMSDVAPADFASRKREEVFNGKTYGNNGPNHASVRIRNGVFRLTGTSASGAKAGSPVYVKAPAGNSGDPQVSLTKGTSDVVIGKLYRAPATASGSQELLVILDTAPAA